jgi:hypothetical protein
MMGLTSSWPKPASSPTNGSGEPVTGKAALVMVTEEYVAALRAFLTGDDDDTFGQLSAHLQARDGSGSGTAYGALQAMALTLAARRRFAPMYTASEVIQFVAQVRAAIGDEVDPLTAERVLRGVLGEPATAEGLDEHAKALAVPALLLVLVSQEKLPGKDLEALLGQAQVMANQMLAEP